MATETIVDIYCHIVPEEFFQEMNRIAPRLGNIAARLRGVKKLFDLDERFREMDAFGDYRQIISLPNPPLEAFTTPTQAVELARRLDPDIVLMDVSMPVLDGFEATREIREESAEVRVLMLTGSNSRDDVDRSREAGAAGYVTKDRIASELVATIVEVTRR